MSEKNFGKSPKAHGSSPSIKESEKEDEIP
jgi:hypothetical protein